MTTYCTETPAQRALCRLFVDYEMPRGLDVEILNASSNAQGIIYYLYGTINALTYTNQTHLFRFAFYSAWLNFLSGAFE